MILALVVLAALAVAGAADDKHRGHAPVDDPRFDFLTRLEGRWVGQPLEEGGPQSIHDFHVTAGGHAIEEREMIGTPMEMLTVYAMQGRDLVATHFCVLGNQPRMVAAERITGDTLDFACAGTPGNAASHDEEHVHGWSMHLDDQGRLHYSAQLVERGAVTEAPTMILTRE